MKKGLKIALRILMWFLIGIITLLAFVLIAIQTVPVKRQITRIAVNQVNNLLTAELSVGELTGNFFTNLGLTEVALVLPEQDTIAIIPEIRLRYKLLPLIKGQIVVDSLIIESPFVSLAELPDSTWNVMHIAKPTAEEPDTTPSSFNMSVKVGELALNGGRLRVVSSNSQIPKEADSLFLNVKGYYSSDYQQIDINKLCLSTRHPDLSVRQIGIQATGDKDAVRLESLLLQTRENKLNASGEYYFDNKNRSLLNVQMAPIRLDEFDYYLPDSFSLKATPELQLNAILENEKLLVDLLLKENLQEIGVHLLSRYLLEYLSDSTSTPVSYDVILKVKQVDLRHWLDNPQLDYLINGNLQAVGEDWDPDKMRVNVKGDFGDIVLSGKSVENLGLTLNYDRGDADAEVKGGGSFGTLYVKPAVRKVLSDNPAYSAVLNTQNLDLAMILGEEYKTDVNLDASIQGSGFDLNKMNVGGQIVARPSVIMGIKLDTLNTNLDFVHQNLTVNDLLIRTMSARLNLAGNYNLQGNSDLALEADLENAYDISKLIGIEDLDARLKLNALLSGTPDSLNADLQLGISPSRYQDFRLDTLFATAEASLKNNFKDINANADIQLNQLAAGGFLLDDVLLKVQTDTRNYKLGLDIDGDDIKTRFNSHVKLGDDIEIVLSDLWLDYKQYVLQQALADTTYINIGKDEYEVRNLRLISDSLNVDQSISLDGIVNRSGEQDLNMDISNLNIAGLMKLFAPKLPLTGLFNFQLNLKGAAEAPEMKVNMYVENMALDQFKFDSIYSDVSLLNKELLLDLNVIPFDSGKIAVNGKLPMDIRLDSMQFNVIPKSTDSLDVRLLIDRLPLAILNVVLPTDQVNGSIESNIGLGGTMQNPQVNGNLNVLDGLVKMDLYGVNYQDIQMGIDVKNDQVNIDTFLIRSRKGTMQAQGNVQFNSEIYKGDLNTSNLNIEFNRFNPLDHKNYNMELSGNVDLEGKRDSVYFSGKLVVPEAQVYLPALMSLFGKRTVQDMPTPLLVTELEKQKEPVDSIVYTFHPDSVDVNSPSFDFLNNLQGSLRVEIPRNTWIRNDDMRFELSGDVEIRKHRDFFELFGTVDVVRGQYNLLGKVFVIQTGTITFQGGEKLNPILDVEASYSFREAGTDNTSSRKEMMIYVTGEMLSPEIKFTLDDEELGEGDAISYILFGSRMSSISNSVAGAADANLAGMVASTLVSSQLTRLLGNVLNVDYIEFNSTSDFQNASITVGKYITNKLFVSYEQNIGNLDNLNDNTVARYEMRMEYELFKFLFLQLTSSPITNGFDVIFKFNSKNK